MSEDNHWQWLASQAPEWVNRGLLTADQARQLLALRPQTAEDRPWLVRIFFGIAALLLGLGVISFFAYNWQAMPRGLKLAIIFSAFAGMHAGGVVFGARPDRAAAAEFCHLLGTLFFGAAVMLIGQIYHVGEHSGDLMLFWSASAGLMAWVLGSTPQLLLFAGLSALWVMDLMPTPPGWVWLYVLAVSTPLAAARPTRMRVLTALLVNAFVCTMETADSPIGFPGLLFTLAALLAGLALAADRPDRRELFAPFRFLAFSCYLVIVMVFSFRDPLRMWLVESPGGPVWPAVVFPGLALTSWAAFALPFSRLAAKLDTLDIHGHLALIFPGYLVTLLLWIAARAGADAAWLAPTGAVLFNLLGAAHGLLLIVAGHQAGSVRRAFAGCLMVSLLILFRFLGMSNNLLLLASVFICLGAGMLTIAILTQRNAAAIKHHD